MYKYLVNLRDSYRHNPIEMFYIDTEDELMNWLNKNKDTMFNWGFNSKEIHLYRIKKGEC